MEQMMGDMDIAFPNLGIYLRNVPKTIMIGNFGIALYGILIAAAMLMGITVAAKIAKKTGQDPDLYWDSFVWIVISAIAGARIYYVIFMWDYYKDNPIEIFNLRGGGLAIYGGIILSVITIFIFCRKKKADPFLFLDTIGFGLVLGQVLGRWGNFFNREVFGEYTDNLLAMRLPISMVRASDISESISAHMEAGTNYIQVHPTFLYEGMWNLMVFFILVICLKKKIKRFHGELFLVYLAGYGIGRAIIENIRTDQLYIPGTKVPVSMVLGIVVAAASIITIIVGRKRFTLINSAEESGQEPQQDTEEETGPETEEETGPETEEETGPETEEETGAEAEEETGADVGQEAEREPEEDTEEDSEEEYGADTKEKTE